MHSPELASSAADHCLPPVFAEIARTLGQLGPLVAQAFASDADRPATIESIISSLAQVEAAFILAGADSLAAITSLAGRVVSRSANDHWSLSDDSIHALQQTFSTLRMAMGRVLSHKRMPLAPLLPCWTALSACDPTANAHPSAMLSLQVDDAMLPAITLSKNLIAEGDFRSEFERALLKFLRAESPEERSQSVQQMHRVIGSIALIESHKQPTSDNVGWAVLYAVTELMVSDLVTDGAALKKILAATGRVVRHLGLAGSVPVPVALVKESLFAIATVQVHTPASACIAQAFNLDAQFSVSDVASPVLAPSDLLLIDAVYEEVQSLISTLDTSDLSVLPVPGQLDNLISLVKKLSVFHSLAMALSRLHTRLSSHQIHPEQGLAIAACLISLQQLPSLMVSTPGLGWFVERIAAALDSIGDQINGPEWPVLHQMGLPLQMSSVRVAVTAAMTDCLVLAERQTERLVQEDQTSSERKATLAGIDHRLSGIRAALYLLGEPEILAHLEKIRVQLRSLVDVAVNDSNRQALDTFAQEFIRLSAQLAAIDRVQEISNDDAISNDAAMQTHADDAVTSVSAFDVHQNLHVIFLAEVTARVQQLREWLKAAHTDPMVSVEAAAHTAHALAGCSATVGLAEMHQLAIAMETLLISLQTNGIKTIIPLRSVLDEALNTLEQMLLRLSSGHLPEPCPDLIDKLLARAVAVPEVQSDPAALEMGPDPLIEASERQVTEIPIIDQASASMRVPVSVDLRNHADHMLADPIMAETSLTDDHPTPVPARSAKPSVDTAHDELHDIFIEEAADLMPQLDQQLRFWIAELSDSAAPAQMLRILHTLKGSARMAGEVALGDALHRMEQTVAELSRQSPPDPAAIRQLEVTLDPLLQPFVPVAPFLSAPISDSPSAVRKISDELTDSIEIPGNDDQKTGAPDRVRDRPATALKEKNSTSLQLRVRADFLDRISDAGAELLVGSSRLASDMQLQRQSVNDLSDNLSRLRAQLRELEIHTESRIASGSSPSANAEFDPLEFDRYTRLHEITRMMSESVADIGSLHRTLSRQLDNAVAANSAQSRYARVLQSELRRVRTLPFASLSGRLQHLLRQIARDKGRDVVLEIDGGHIEVDRSVLDRITGSLEHLVRNAVAHGIETAAERLSKDKPATGRVKISLSQQGGSLLWQVSDDGHGLDYQRIRERAVTQGLLAPEASVNERALSDLIFEPGFSTATEITELSGRGIGMDAVRESVIALGGQLSVASQTGIGTCFTLSLPLTLATMQVVLVKAGSRDVALPATLVQQMLQLSSSVLLQARVAGSLEWQGRHLPLHSLAHLLGEQVDGDLAHRTSVAVLRQLDHYLAIELDAVVGHREVVVKNTGPQLAQVPGLVGATVLGDGRITLIINPLPLPEFVASHVIPANDGSLNGRAKPVPRILVVDDSLTVRRASQRLLERHGYEVMLARDGLDALDQLRVHLPVAVLLDIEMPRMDGFELLTALRDDARWSQLPVAMTTSRTAERHREHAMKLGATAYLGKPFAEDELLALLTQWLVPVPTGDKLDLS